MGGLRLGLKGVGGKGNTLHKKTEMQGTEGGPCLPATFYHDSRFLRGTR